ncbi:Uncharacterised protein [uncultured archaeon]|nr:Uncharacterised protein [uncultured archaeon]
MGNYGVFTMQGNKKPLTQPPKRQIDAAIEDGEEKLRLAAEGKIPVEDLPGVANIPRNLRRLKSAKEDENYR